MLDAYFTHGMALLFELDTGVEDLKDGVHKWAGPELTSQSVYKLVEVAAIVCADRRGCDRQQAQVVRNTV